MWGSSTKSQVLFFKNQDTTQVLFCALCRERKHMISTVFYNSDYVESWFLLYFSVPAICRSSAGSFFTYLLNSVQLSFKLYFIIKIAFNVSILVEFSSSVQDLFIAEKTRPREADVAGKKSTYSNILAISLNSQSLSRKWQNISTQRLVTSVLVSRHCLILAV